jgi:acyl-CoA thioester hydrolase
MQMSNIFKKKTSILLDRRGIGSLFFRKNSVQELPMHSDKVFSINIEVRFRDLDALGHVNNSVFFTYFEEGRKHFSNKVFDVSDSSDFEFIMAHIRCDFIRPIRLNDHVILHMWVKDIGTKSFSFEYLIVDFSVNTKIYAAGESTQVWYDYDKNRSVEVPVMMRERMTRYLK